MRGFIFTMLVLSTTALISGKYNGPTNQAGVDLIKGFEGFRANFYLDAVKIKTIGYGHACHALPCSTPIYGKYSVPLSQANGEALLKDDLVKGSYESCVSKEVTYEGLTANQYSALVSFVFNLGCPNFKKSTLLAKLNQGDVAGAAEEFKRWNKAGGKVLAGLTKRREAERTLFCDGANCGSGSSGSSSASSTCTGKITASSLFIRSGPDPSTSKVGSLAKEQMVTLENRVAGQNVGGNSYWFKISNGYIAAYYVDIVGNNGASWCKKN